MAWLDQVALFQVGLRAMVKSLRIEVVVGCHGPSMLFGNAAMMPSLHLHLPQVYKNTTSMIWATTDATIGVSEFRQWILGLKDALRAKIA